MKGLVGWRFKVQGMTVQSSGDDGSKVCGSTVSIRMSWIVSTPNRLSESHLWRVTRVALSLDLISDRNVASSCVHFLYKYHTPSSFISLLFAETHCQSTSVILVKEHSVYFLHPSSSTFIRSLANLVITLLSTSLSYPRTYSFYFSRLYTPVTPSRPVRVFGFAVTCRQCLVH